MGKLKRAIEKIEDPRVKIEARALREIDKKACKFWLLGRYHTCSTYPNSKFSGKPLPYSFSWHLNPLAHIGFKGWSLLDGDIQRMRGEEESESSLHHIVF